MEPIVNPALIYLIGTVEALKALCFIVSLCTWVWIILMYSTSIAEDDEEFRLHSKKELRKYMGQREKNPT